MHRRNTGTAHTGPGDRPNRPARLTRQKTFEIRHCRKRENSNQSTHLTSPARQEFAATRSLHNSPWCGLRSRLGVVHQHPSGSDSTRQLNQLSLSQLADLWQVYLQQIDHRQVHLQLADPLPYSCRRPCHAAVFLRDVAVWMQPAAAWLCLSAAAACSSPAAAHAANASLLLPLLQQLVLHWQLPLLALTTGSTSMDAWTLGTACALDRGRLGGL